MTERTVHLSSLRRPPVLWLSALLIVVIAVWASVTWINSALGSGTCAQRTVVEIAAAPTIAPVLNELAGGRPVTSCSDVRVSAKDSTSFADALANPPAGRQPQVWVPESTFWLGRAQARGAFTVPATGTSIASTPVVVAMTEAAAGQFGWPAQPVAWSALLGPQATTLAVGVPDPAADPVGIAGLVGVQAITAPLPDAGAAESLVLRRLSQHVVTRASDLYLRLPEAGSGGDTLSAFLTSEQALLRHNGRTKGTPLVAAYPTGQVPTLDFPYVVLPGADEPEVSVATAFLSRLLAPEARRALQGAGFRDPDGSPPPATIDPEPTASRVRLDPMPPVPMPNEDDLVQVLSRWTGVHLSARILGVIDVSGSMNERVGGQTRLSLLMQTAQEGLGLLLDTTEVGVWVFSTRMEGNRDYQVLVPPGPLSQQRARIYSALGAVRAKPDGDTGLYDTTLAAYQDARRNWMPGRINLVLVATDGRNEDDQSIGRARLIAELGKLVDPRRPLPILFFAMGPGVDLNELNEIAKVVDGRVYNAAQPSDIRPIFFSALSDFGCQPPSCRN
jgi:hypothetical protein